MLRSHRSRLSLENLENRFAPAIYTVTVPVTPGAGSLDEAISKANFNPGHDTVDFGPLFNLPQVIALANEIAITDGVTIIGTSAANVTISGKNLTRIFNSTGAPSTASIRLVELTLANGNANGAGGAILAGDERITADYCDFDRNSASDAGGAIAVEAGGSLLANDCRFTANTATTTGGAVHVGGGPTSFAVLTRDTLTGNSAGRGGALNIEREFQLYDSTIDNNKSLSDGGGIRLTNPDGVGSFFIRNSTISSNGAGDDGGGVAMEGIGSTLKVHNSTFTLNSARQGGGMAVISGNGTIQLESTVVSKDSAPIAPEISTPSIVAYKYSALGSSQGIAILQNQGNNLLLGTNVKLAALANNGGPTRTHAFLPGSPLLNTGSNPGSVALDQRGAGFVRTTFGATDIGAYEQQGVTLAPPTISLAQVNDGTAQRSNVFSLRVVFSEAVTFPDGIDEAFRLERLGPGAPVGDVMMKYNPNESIDILSFHWGVVPVESMGSLIDGRYRLTIFADKVMGEYGLLDGNGDGNSTPGPDDDFNLNFHRLYGDGDGDGAVTSNDFALFRQAFGTSMNMTFDADGDGFVTADEFAAFRMRFGISFVP